MKPLLVYLANLVHINERGIANPSVPLNIGFLAAYAKKMLGPAVELRIFSLPAELEAAMAERQPQVLCATNYAWGANLNYHYLAHYKERSPELVTVMGGPNIPSSPRLRQQFLARRPLLDFYLAEEAEGAFVELLRSCLTQGLDISRMRAQPPPNSLFLAGAELVSGPLLPRIRQLDDIPSPYLEGWMDPFLESGFTPLLQSNRGCPFQCTFCVEGDEYFSRVNQFSVERFAEEVEYIARRAKSPSVYITDSNFGMFKRDLELCRKLKQAQEQYHWPVFVSASTGKNSRERVLACVEVLGKSLPLSASVQSTSATTLALIKRDNMRLQDFWAIQKRLKELGARSFSEIIVPLPGETLASHLEGIRQLMELRIDEIIPHIAMLLPATPLGEEDIERYQLSRRFRVLSNDFGSYLGRHLLEVEQVCVATRELSLDDYFQVRSFHFFVYCFYNGGTFSELYQYLHQAGYHPYDFTRDLMQQMPHAPEAVRDIYSRYQLDIRAELFDSEEALLSRYSDDEGYARLTSAEEGINLLLRGRGRCFAAFSSILEYSIEVARRGLQQRGYAYDAEVLRSIHDYILHSRGKLFEVQEGTTLVELPYDIHTWKQEAYRTALPERRATRLAFVQTDRQRQLLEQYRRLYGHSIDGHGRILTRLDKSMLYWDVAPAAGAAPSVSREGAAG